MLVPVTSRTDPILPPDRAQEGLPEDDLETDVSENGSELRLLVLMRHAKAAGHSGADHDRPLTEGGRKAAAQMGRWLVAQGVRPDVVVVSPSVRTLQTWEGLRVGGLRAEDVWADAGIYNAEVADLVESITSVPNDVKTLLVIGHAPAVGDLSAGVEDHTGGEESTPAAQRAWPPGAVGVVAHRGPWMSFPSDDTALVTFHTP